jgi:S1-C subfamily serine protease
LRAGRARRDGNAAEARRWFLVCIATGRTDSAQWQVAYAALELDASTPATLGCEMRRIPDTDPPRLEVATLQPLGPAELQGLRVGDRITMVNDQPATIAAFTAAAKACVLGTTVRLAIDSDAQSPELRIAAGVATK